MASLPLILALVVALTLAIRRIAPQLHNVPNNPLEGLIGDHPGTIWLFLLVVIFAGGVPLRRAGKVVGAVGVSGGSGEQDHAVAEAGAATMS